ncbi:MAG TPA: hypothetical protein VGG16_14195 [Streptosporangiaceae bacterium]|jgi:hypothetical protein
MKTRIFLIAGAVLLALASMLIVPGAAHASTGGPGITCSGGSSCMIEVENEVHFGGNYSQGTDNLGISVTPPCYWTPLGNAHTGSITIVANLADSQEYGGQLTGILEQIYQQAYKMQNENPMPPGEWYMQLSTSAQYDALCDKVPFEFVTPSKGGAVNPPPVPLTPRDLAELAIAVMQFPTANGMTTSPKGLTTYSNLPTFVAVKMRPPVGGLHYSGGMPYVAVSAQLAGAGATAWGYASTLKLNVSGTGYSLTTSGCGYLGSPELIKEPAVVARVGTGGHLDCGVTFREPQQGAQVTAKNVWTVCYVLQPENEPGTAPPVGACHVYGQMNPTEWNKDFNVEEIQAGNG